MSLCPRNGRANAFVSLNDHYYMTEIADYLRTAPVCVKSTANLQLYQRRALTPYATGFPLMQHFLKKKQTTQGGFNLGGTNATGQVPKIPGNYALIDNDTPQEAYTKKSYLNPDQDMVLVFSDEFNQDGRTFYPGEDPYWEAVDLHYWGTVS
jgi:hypothetical protein